MKQDRYWFAFGGSASPEVKVFEYYHSWLVRFSEKSLNRVQFLTTSKTSTYHHIPENPLSINPLTLIPHTAWMNECSLFFHTHNGGTSSSVTSSSSSTSSSSFSSSSMSLALSSSVCRSPLSGQRSRSPERRNREIYGDIHHQHGGGNQRTELI